MGARVFYEVTDGAIKGKRLSAKLLSGGGDWVLFGPDGYARLDARFQFVTDDEATVYALYPGLLELNEKVVQASAAGFGTEYRDQYFRIAPRFETGDPRYSWLNQNLFVGEGRLIAGGIEHKVYRVI
jgi:hypothetical protein